MKRLRATLVVVCLAGFASSVFAADVWVSRTGSNQNTCGFLDPCSSLQNAFDHLVAYNNGQGNVLPGGLNGGTIHVLDAGAYGFLTVTQSVTLDGGGATTLDFNGDIHLVPQITIAAGAADVVTIENLTISGSRYAPSAIAVTSVGALHVKNCTFSDFTQGAIDFEATGAYLEMTDVTISNIQGGTAVNVANARGSLDNVHIHHTQTAVLAAGSSTVSVRRSTFNGNGEALAAAYGPTAELHIDDCMLTNNEWAVVVSQGAKAYVSRSSLFNNVITALFNDGSSSLISYGNNQLASNASDGTFTSTMNVK